MKIKNLDEVILQLKEHLHDYLGEHGRNPNKLFSCIHPDHEDKNPSCSATGGNRSLFRCLSCMASGDIFTAAHYLENKPLTGQAFITDTVIPLAEKYDIEIEQAPLTEEEIYRVETYRAYASAASLLSTEHASEAAKEEIAKRGWSAEICDEYGIGSVLSFKEFRNTLKKLGFTAGFQDDVDLGRDSIIGENCLTFPIKDEHGRVVGFATKNLAWDGNKEHGTKYNNQKHTGVKCNIYKKSTRLFGIDRVIKKHKKTQLPRLYIFEGYSDVVTAADHGLDNCVALGSADMSHDQIQLLKEQDMHKVCLVLDGDETGRRQTQVILDDRLSTHKQLSIEIVVMPDGTDPDGFIREEGIEKFKELKRWSAFEWRLNQFEEDASEEDVCKSMIPLIVSEPSHVKQDVMCKTLAKATGIDLRAIKGDVEKIQNSRSAEKSKQRQKIIDRLIYSVQGCPDDADDHLYEASNALFDVAKQYEEDTLSEESFVRALEEQQQKEEEKTSEHAGMYLGDDLQGFEQAFSGEWKDNWFCFAADENCGKCVSYDSEIVDPTTGQICTIEEMVKNPDGKFVFTVNQEGQIKTVRPDMFIDSGIQETIKVTNKFGMFITGTLDHPVLTIDGWKKLKNLKETDCIAMPGKCDISHLPDFDVSDEEIRLLGYFLAEGCLTKGAGICNTSPEIIEDFYYCINKIFGDTLDIRIESRNDPKRANSYYTYHTPNLKLKRKVIAEKITTARKSLNLTIKGLAEATGCTEGQIAQVERRFVLLDKIAFRRITRYLKLELTRQEEWTFCFTNPCQGLLDWFSLSKKLSKEKSLPKQVFSFSERQLKILLSVLWDTDGSYYSKDKICIEMALASEKMTKQIQHILLRLGIPSYFRHKQVKLGQKTFDAWVTTITSLVYAKRFVKETTSLNKNQARNAILERKGTGTGYYSIKAKYGSLLFVQIKKIERTGRQQVYDLTIDKTHNFIANDIVVHNTALMCKMGLSIATIPENNAMVIIHTIDDTREQLVPRLVTLLDGTRTLPINAIVHPAAFDSIITDLRHKRTDGYVQLKELAKEGRVIVKDANDGSNLAYAHRLIKFYRNKYPERRIIYVLDNFHKLNEFQNSQSDDRNKYKRTSEATKRLATHHHITVFSTVEYRKNQAGRSNRSNDDVAETKSISYDANVIIHMYNDLHEQADNATHFHVALDPEMKEPIKMPRVRARIRKNKVSHVKGDFWFDFYPSCSDWECVDIRIIEERENERQQENETDQENKSIYQ